MKGRYLIYASLMVLCAVVLYGQENNDPLVAAYKKEFVFLDTEIRLLEDRIKEIETDGEQRVRDARNDLDILEEQHISLDLQIQERTEDLRLLEERHSRADEAQETINAVLEQGNSRLSKHGIPGFQRNTGDDGNSDTVQEIRYLFSESLKLLHQSGSIRKVQDDFFLKSGKKADGDIIHIGEIASVGYDGENAGPLVPAGGGALRMDRVDNSHGIKALYEGRIPESLNFFLYESIDESVETAMKKTLMDTIKGGGFIGLIIIFLGFASLVLIILRTVLLVQSGRGVTEDIELLAASVEKRDWKAAGEFAGKTEGSLSRVLIATVNALKTDPEKADDTIAESIMNEQPRLDRYRIPLSVFAAVSPLLGLLGTVTGMIATFDIITVYGTGDPKLLSGGISEALITTMFGLIVAIPVLLVGNLLSSRAASITSALEVKALRLVNAFPGKESR